MSETSKPYEYFDTPDGHDLDKKLWVVLKPTVATAIAISTADVMLYSHPKGYLKTLGRYVYISAPIIGMGTAFVLATNLATNIRKSDDRINWAIGGLVAGGVFGAWKKSQLAGWLSGGALGALGMGKKYCMQNGIVLVPKKIQSAAGGLMSVRHDYTFTKDNPGAWKIKD